MYFNYYIDLFFYWLSLKFIRYLNFRQMIKRNGLKKWLILKIEKEKTKEYESLILSLNLLNK